MHLFVTFPPLHQKQALILNLGATCLRSFEFLKMHIKVLFTNGPTMKRIILVIPPQGFCEGPFKPFARVKYEVVCNSPFNVL